MVVVKHLVLGGARSGKSSFAERNVLETVDSLESPRCPKYIATATAIDEEMASRIHHHQQTRGTRWALIECPLSLSETIATFDAEDVVLIDCLTLWLNNVIYSAGEMGSDEDVEQKIDALINAIQQSPATIYLVSNEVGLGVVPLGEVSRRFVDHAGRLNQKVAAVCTNVTLIAAGLPLVLKAS